MKSIFQLAIPPYSFKDKSFRMKCQTSITIPAAIPKPEIKNKKQTYFYSKNQYKNKV